jgi:hypothetical protein
MPILVFADGYTTNRRYHLRLKRIWFHFLSAKQYPTPRQAGRRIFFSPNGNRNDIIVIILSSTVVHYSYHNLSVVTSLGVAPHPLETHSQFKTPPVGLAGWSAMADPSRVRAQGVSKSILEQSEMDLTNLRIGKQRLVSKKKRLSCLGEGWEDGGKIVGMGGKSWVSTLDLLV